MYKKIARYVRLIGVVQTMGMLFNNIVKPRSRMLLKIGNVRLWVRTGTHDVPAVLSVLADGEYRDVHHADPNVIIDAGAHVGSSVLYFADRWPRVRIYAIEPDHENCELLRKNVGHLDNVTVIEAALSSHSGRSTLSNEGRGTWGFALVGELDAATDGGAAVDCISITELIDRYQIERISILKLDIEGGEKDVLNNSEAWIDRVDVLTAELHERLLAGCDLAFQTATRNFGAHSALGEKITAHRK